MIRGDLARLVGDIERSITIHLDDEVRVVEIVAGTTHHEQSRYAELVAQLEVVVAAGLSRAETELGHRLGLPSVPATIGMLVGAWAQGKLAELDPNNADFQELFSELAERAAA